MSEKNPYENGVNIPDFVNDNADKDVDLSVFKMSEAEREMDEEYEDEEPKRKLSARGTMIIEAVIIVVLLLVAIGGWVFGISKSNGAKKAKAELETVNAQLAAANSDVSTLKAQNVSLQEQLTALQKGKDEPSSSNEPEADKTMTTIYALGVRKAPNDSKASYVDFDKLPHSIQDICNYNESTGRVEVKAGSKIPVYKTEKDTDGKTWGKILYNLDAWVCIHNGTEEYAK